MKKLLIIILIGLLIALSVYIVLNGLVIGENRVLSIDQIKTENEALDLKIQLAAMASEKDFKAVETGLTTNIKEFEAQKQKYEELVALNTDENGSIKGFLEEYDFENLWVKIGNYATDENAVMQLDITKGSSVISNSYQLNFTMTGSYISIIDFVSKVENDDALGFKIEEFSLLPSEDSEDLVAKFSCSDIIINGITEEALSDEEVIEGEEGAEGETTSETGTTVNPETKETTEE